MNFSGNPDKGYHWLKGIEIMTFEQLHDTGGRSRLDQELMTAMTRARTGDLGLSLGTLEEEMANKGTPIRGRQTTNHIFE